MRIDEDCCMEEEQLEGDSPDGESPDGVELAEVHSASRRSSSKSSKLRRENAFEEAAHNEEAEPIDIYVSSMADDDMDKFDRLFATASRENLAQLQEQHLSVANEGRARSASPRSSKKSEPQLLETPLFLTRSCSCKRESSVKKIRRASRVQQEVQDEWPTSDAARRARSGSLPVEQLLIAQLMQVDAEGRPLDATLTQPSAAEGTDGDEADTYRLRNFAVTKTGGLVNRGDSFKRSKKSRGSRSTVSSQSLVDNRPDDCQRTLIEEEKRHEADDTDTLNVAVIGDVGVGKTSLTQQFTTSEYMGTYDYSASQDEETVRAVSVQLEGAESRVRFLDVNVPHKVPLQEMDLATMDAFVIVYSVTEKASYLTAAEIIRWLRDVIPGSPRAIILVGNKSDIVRNRQVPKEDGRVVAMRYHCKFVETSAAINHRVDELLAGIVKQIRLHKSPPEVSSSVPEKKPGFFAKLFSLRKKKKKAKKTNCEDLYSMPS